MGLLLALLAPLGLAGCLAEAPRPEPERDAGPAIVATAAAEPTPPGASEADEEAGTSGMVATTLSWEGSTASAACVPLRCQIVQQPERSWSEFSGLGVPGRPVRASGTLTWEPATPATEELRVFVFSLDAEGMVVDGTEVRGPSPLAFDVDLWSWTGEDFAYSLHGHHEAAGFIVETSQPFHMDTTILSLVDEP